MAKEVETKHIYNKWYYVNMDIRIQNQGTRA